MARALQAELAAVAEKYVRRTWEENIQVIDRIIDEASV